MIDEDTFGMFLREDEADANGDTDLLESIAADDELYFSD